MRHLGQASEDEGRGLIFMVLPACRTIRVRHSSFVGVWSSSDCAVYILCCHMIKQEPVTNHGCLGWLGVFSEIHVVQHLSKESFH